MRLFVALDIEPSLRDAIARFADGLRVLAPDARWVNPESFHITLKFIGETDEARVSQIKQALRAIHSPPTTVAFRGHGFFPSPRSARVFWAGMEADEHLAELAKKVDAALAPLGIASEARAFSPHLTLARTGSGRPQRQRSDGPNNIFQRVQRKLEAAPPFDFGTMTANSFYLYQSRLSPKGARYTKLEGFELKA